MKIGYIGLGRMGKNMVLRLLEQGIEVVAWNRSPQPLEEVVKAGAIASESLKDLVSKLRSDSSLRGASVAKPASPTQRGEQSNSEIATLPSVARNDGVVVWLMLPAGEIVDEFIDKLLLLLEPQDLLIDGANSFYKDTLKRWAKIKPTGVHFMDIGVSGGPGGARNGACLMIGGSENDFLGVEPLLKAAAAPGAYQHLGEVGAGHFAKMVHNGIEYGMMEALGEGLSVLKNSSFNFNFEKLLDIYNHKSVIESRLVGWAQNAFKEDPELLNTSSTIGSGGAGAIRIKGEADWTVEVAKELGIDTPAIENAIFVRENSASVEENSGNGFRNKVVSALRGQFGHHAVKK